MGVDSALPVVDRVRPLVRENLHAIAPYVPGRPIADVMSEYGLQDVVKLASNENPWGPSPKVVAALQHALGAIHRYPDGAAKDLRAAIASQHGLQPESVLVSNGSDEMIKMLSETFLDHGDEVVVPYPSFAQYSSGAMVMGATIVQAPLRENLEYDIEAMVKSISPRTKLVYLCTPNNPTGTWLTHEQVRYFLDQIPQNIVVALDEAYLEYVTSTDPVRSLEFIREGRPVLSLRTFSKIYGLAGLRLGYALGDPQFLAFVNQVREPFNVNVLAQTAALAALSDQEHVALIREKNDQGRKQYYEALDQLGISYCKTQANFILVNVGDGLAIFDAMQQLGVIVRAGFAGLSQYVRISIGTTDENERCLQALEAVVER